MGRATLTKLGSLTPPSSLTRTWRQILVDRRALAGDSVIVGNALKTVDTCDLKAVSASKRAAHARLPTIAGRRGFKDCANVGLSSEG